MRRLILTALLVFCMAGAALAQETPTSFCGNLSEADCAILTHAQEATANLDSASFDVDLTMTISDIPDMSSPLTFTVTGSGAYGGLNSVRANLTGAAESTDIAELVYNLLHDLSADATITFSFPPELVQMTNGQLPSSITLQERLVDGIGYLNLDTLQALMPDSSLSGWYGLDLANLLKSAVEEMPDMFNGSMPNADMMQEYEQAFGDSEFYSRFISIERTDDGSTDTATFQIVLDMGKLMGSPAMQDIMRQQMMAQDSQMTDAQANEALAMSTQMFKGMSMTLTEDVGIDDGFMHRASGTLSIDTKAMMGSMSDMSGGTGRRSTAPPSAPKIDIEFSYSYSDFNDAPVITAPEDPTIIPYQSLISPSVTA